LTQKNDTNQPDKYRQLPGIQGIIVNIMLSALPVIGILYILDVAGYAGKTFYSEQYFGLMFTLAFTAGFLILPATKGASRSRLPWYDLVFALLALSAGSYIVFFYPSIIYSLGIIEPERVVLGTIMILVSIELCRRLFGWPLVVLCIGVLLYARFNYVIPGQMGGPGISSERLATSLYLYPTAILGIPARIVFTIVLAFILFGQVMFATGGGRAVTNLALATVGRYRGGPAKVAVIASSMFGTLSGSAAANVLTTGQVTIPMMKNTGYKPRVAAAIEAVASSGGLLMPPIMGAAAFLMAEFLGISYGKVVVAALVPAVLYYLAIFIHVDLEARKNGISGIPPHLLPQFRGVLSSGWTFIIPFAVLIYCLFIINLTPARSALYSTACFFVVSALRKETRLTFGSIRTCLENTGRFTLEMSIVVAIAGIIIGVVGLTGAGVSLSQVLIDLSSGSTAVLLVLAAVASIILGMGMPITATYIVVAVLIAPALVQLNIEPIAAHLFVLYFGVLSFVTPPVCVAVYPAAMLANSDVMRTGLTAVKLGIVAYIVPFLFVYNSGLLLKGNPGEIALAIITTAVGFSFLAVAIQGYLFRKLPVLNRISFSIGAILLLWNNWISEIIGIAIIITLLLYEWRKRRELQLN